MECCSSHMLRSYMVAWNLHTEMRQKHTSDLHDPYLV